MWLHRWYCVWLTYHLCSYNMWQPYYSHIKWGRQQFWEMLCLKFKELFIPEYNFKNKREIYLNIINIGGDYWQLISSHSSFMLKENYSWFCRHHQPWMEISLYVREWVHIPHPTIPDPYLNIALVRVDMFWKLRSALAADTIFQYDFALDTKSTLSWTIPACLFGWF